jgi:hypothetical protein
MQISESEPYRILKKLVDGYQVEGKVVPVLIVLSTT